MTHLLICREYPPAPYGGGGIGTYLATMARLLAQAGEQVHVIAQQHPAATSARDESIEGRLVVHRVPVDRPLGMVDDRAWQQGLLNAFAETVVPSQAFAWQAAVLAEDLIGREAVDVIEAQEYEAPLYALFLRRARGLARGRTVPVVVHLHSPSELVFEHNGTTGRADARLLPELEAYTIRSADGWLCPSRGLAAHVESRYGLPAGSVAVIPYPLGDVPGVPARDAETWRSGPVLYVGRLEARKGVHEWAAAAAAVAPEYPAQVFAFVGADTPVGATGTGSVRTMLQAAVSAAGPSRFLFSDAVPRPALGRYRAAARVAVVPSRWENYPYTCMEAMASGVPVLVTPGGGMAEMIEDGACGWIAAGADAASLTVTLRRALATPPDTLKDMGVRAAARIRSVCDNETVVARHLAFKQALHVQGTRPSPPLVAPLELPEPLAGRPSRRATRGIQTDTLTPGDVLAAPLAQKVAIARRALAEPRHIARWLAWHARRVAAQVTGQP